MTGNRAASVMVILFIILSCSTSKKNTGTTNILPATSLQPFGRFITDKNLEVELISSAVHFGFSFEGNECQLFASVPRVNEHNYLQYVLDGIYQKRIRISGNTGQPISLTAPNSGRHTIWVYKATEAHTGPIYIQKVVGKNIQPIASPSAPLIEFIGNSITCGAAADASETPCGLGEYQDHHNAYYSYGPRVARALGANFLMSCVSGIGIYRNWNSDGPAMPQEYEKIDFQANNPLLWNFTAYTPGVVSIALGTNDFSNGDGIKKRAAFDSAVFIGSYIKFVQMVQSKYPDAQIALLSSPMVGGANRLLLQNCLQTVKQRIDVLYSSHKPVALHFFQPMQAHGCSGHPSVEDHALLAEELVPFFKKLLL